MQVNGAVAEKCSRQIAPADQLHVTGPPPRYVGRGAYKLEHGLTTFDIDPDGRRCLDAGASTGGFTDVLIQGGADHVYAVDVGHGQLHERLRAHDRVTNLERTNIRHISASEIPQPVDLIVGDLSFISLSLVIDPLLGVCVPGADLVLLVKPQFEAGRQEVAKGAGVITDPGIWERVRNEIDVALVERGCTVRGWVESPITGADGNHEFLVYAVAPTREHVVEL